MRSVAMRRDERIDRRPVDRPRVGFDPARFERDDLVDARQRRRRREARRTAEQREPVRAERPARAAPVPSAARRRCCLGGRQARSSRRGPSSNATASLEVARDERCARDLLAARHRPSARGWRARRPPARPRRPRRCRRRRRTPRAARRARARPRGSDPARACGTRTRPPARARTRASAPSGPSRSTTRALTASTSSRVSFPCATPAWFDTSAVATPAARNRSSASRAPGIGSTRAGSRIVRNVAHERAVAVEQHGGRRRPRRARAVAQQVRQTRVSARAVVHGAERQQHRRRGHRGDLVARARSRRDAAPREAGGSRRPDRRRERAHARLAGGERGERERGRRDRQRVRAEGAVRRAGALAPAAPVQRRHQHVVGVAGLQPHADRPRRGPHRVRRAPSAAHDALAAGDDAQREIGVLAVRARKSFVEPAGSQAGRCAGTRSRR